MKWFRYIKKGIKNLIYWFPVIWYDRNFDHYYLCKILEHKLEDMQKFYNGPNAWSVDAPELAKSMKECVDILNRIMEDDYNREGFDQHDKKWGELQMSAKLGKLMIYRDKVSENLKEQESKEYQLVCDKEVADRNKDIDKLFSIMKENLLKWWD